MTVRACVRAPVLWRTLALGIGFQALVVLSAWFLVHAILLELSFGVVAVSLPPALILSVLPISIAGFGVREGSYVLLLGHAGVSATDATLFSLLSGGRLRAREPAGRVRYSSAGGRTLSAGRRRPRIESTKEAKKIWTPATTTVAASRATSP